MHDHDRSAARFEAHRGYLREVAYRMLGSLSDAEDAVQEAWIRLSRTDIDSITNLPAWLTTVVSRICLDALRSRASRPEQPWGVTADEAAVLERLEPVDGGGDGPEVEAVLADTVGLALLTVLTRLSPAERVAFVLHDLFAVPFGTIAPIVERAPTATKKLASRARHRVRGEPAVPAPVLAEHQHVAEAFLAAARGGDLASLLRVLAPDVVRRSDPAALRLGGATEIRGARAVADEAPTNLRRAQAARLALVDGHVGLVVAPLGRLSLVLALAISSGRITEIEVIAEPSRLGALDLAVLGA